MEKLTNEEILAMIDHFNKMVDVLVMLGANLEITHYRTGEKAPLRPLLKKLLDEGVARGIIQIPSCFKLEREVAELEASEACELIADRWLPSESDVIAVAIGGAL